VPERLRGFVAKLFPPEADIVEHIVAKLAQSCRERARSRHSGMAAMIRRNAVSGAIAFGSVRRRDCPKSAAISNAHKGAPRCAAGSKVRRDEARTVAGRRATLRR
jgi:hypothetical protein